MENKNEIDEALAIGAEKARKVAQDVLQRVRAKVGYQFQTKNLKYIDTCELFKT